METWQLFFVSIWGLVNLLFAAIGLFQTKIKNNPFGLCHLGIFGSFVWGDSVIFGLFWFLVAIFAISYFNWILFCFIYFVFWVVRSFGESNYWIHEQFSLKKKNSPDDFKINKIFSGESTFFANQIIWQVICVASIVGACYFGRILFLQI